MKRHLMFLVLSLAVASCGSKDPKPVTSPGSEGAESTSGGEKADGGRCMPDGPGYEVTEYDTSGDNIPDVRKLFKMMGQGTLARLVLVCREADLNGDRRKDVVRLYTDEGRPMREEADRDFDGRMDEITLFTNGRVSLQEVDTNGNGVIDTKIFFEGGQPVRAERDMANRSTAAEWRPDRWEYYVDGRTVRIGSDLNGDGKVDRWDRDEERLRTSALANQQSADDSVSQ
ncbi:MAG: hypothetical protein OEV36_03890 [Myxococcales bacterium]|nr:hypothetical protein [Myxococcales bacterium]